MSSPDDTTRFLPFVVPGIKVPLPPGGRAISGRIGRVGFIITHDVDGLVIATLIGAAGKVGDGVVRHFFRHWGIAVPTREIDADMFSNPRLRGWIVRHGRDVS